MEAKTFSEWFIEINTVENECNCGIDRYLESIMDSDDVNDKEYMAFLFRKYLRYYKKFKIKKEVKPV